ncbi:sugar phosphate isomerase/epimerase family protein [Pseudonocardia sp. GCM10023141]|uniref:sugar phosphate isomerase/epimerase family protein n=1 Tax=Pseudonocardia sp. GCM10023141 TaxID=3252653 RepID=UPI00360A0CBD
MDRLSLNQFTIRDASLTDAVDACVRAGIPAIGLWREHVGQIGVEAAARYVTDAGLRVSSLCRGGFLTATDPRERAAAIADNRAAIEEAAALGAPCLVLVVGGLPAGSTDLAGARAAVLDAVGELAPYAGELGVRLALEALHPMYCADRAVLSTLGQALDWAERFPVEQVGVVVDTFHLWWDPAVLDQIARAGERIASYQVSDWVTPLPADVLLGRGMMGDGHIDFAPLTDAVAAAGYRGDIEVEIFNRSVWETPPDTVLATMCKRYVDLIAK